MRSAFLYTYTHKFNEYPTFQCVAPDRNTANAMLAIHTTENLPDYDGRNCDWDCTERAIAVVLDEDVAQRVVEYALTL